MRGLVHLCRSEAIPEGAARGFLPGPGARCAVIVLRRGGKLSGFQDSCPHYAGGTPMAWRSDAYLNRSGQIVCHAHGAVFDPETGVCILGPCLGRRLTRVPLHIDAQGNVMVSDHLADRQERAGK